MFCCQKLAIANEPVFALAVEAMAFGGFGDSVLEIERRPVQAAPAISDARAVRADPALVFGTFRGAARRVLMMVAQFVWSQPITGWFRSPAPSRRTATLSVPRPAGSTVADLIIALTLHRGGSEGSTGSVQLAGLVAYPGEGVSFFPTGVAAANGRRYEPVGKSDAPEQGWLAILSKRRSLDNP